jgi:hypothetical protein
MKSNKAFILAALALALFFLAQFAAELAFLSAPVPKTDARAGKPRFSLIDLSLSSRLHTDAAFAMLEAGSNEKDSEKVVKASMTLLKQSLRRNPLDYQARYYLSKAYLRFSAVNNDYFDLGVRELKRAASIRGSNKGIALDCGKVFFSLWPLLEEEDRVFCSQLLAGVMPAVSWSEFRPLVEMWSLYVQDAPLLMDLLKLKPDFFGPAAEQLAASGLPLTKRWEMLALHEVNTLDSLERRSNELGLEGGIPLADARSLLNQARTVKGYHRLYPGAGFKLDKYLKLRRALLIDVIDAMIAPARNDAQQAVQLREMIEYYIAEHPGLGELDQLQKLLQDRNYFQENDFPSLRLKTMIAYKKSDHGGVIAEIESLRKGVSFVKKEQAADYTDILLLLVDSYYSSKLMTTAEAIARELYQNQPDNPDVLWRVLRIQNILGVEGLQDPELQAKLTQVRDSRFLTVDRFHVPYTVYLFNEPGIEVTIAPDLRAKITPGQLVQVFVDDQIAFESYGRNLPEKIVIGPPWIKIESKAKVQVSII